MATRWSNLPGEILSVIADLLGTDVDLLRLRSVCSSWRSSLSPPKKRFSFPVKLPPLLRSKHRIEGRNGYFVLKENTIYRLSPPADGDRAGDPSSGWLFKVTEKNPNSFSLLNPIVSKTIEDTEGLFPKTLNLLDYRFSEICKSHSLDFVSLEESTENGLPFNIIKKVFVLWNYVNGCDFVVILLPFGTGIDIWKFGDESWTRMDVKGCRFFDDVIQHAGKCYAIDIGGRIVHIDSSLNMTDVCFPVSHLQLWQNYLAKCGLNLFVVSNLNSRDPQHPLHPPLHVKVLKVSKEMESGIIPEFWYEIEDLEDKVFILAGDVSIGVSAKDFTGCKRNYICLNDECFQDGGNGGVYGEDNGVYDFDEKIIKPLVKSPEYAEIFWPPPKWLMHD